MNRYVDCQGYEQVRGLSGLRTGTWTVRVMNRYVDCQGYEQVRGLSGL